MTSPLNRPFVVSLSGVPGSGKTTLLHLLQKDYPGAQIVAYDHFHPGMSEQQIEDWIRRTGDANELPLAELIEQLFRLTQTSAEAVSRPLILFETAFGRAHRATGVFIDFSVWIDTPLDIALARATLVFLDQVARDRAPNAAANFIAWLTRYMEDYPLLRRMYLAARERGMANADLVVDGALPADASARLIKKALAEHGVPMPEVSR
jgi:uridine kinase